MASERALDLVVEVAKVLNDVLVIDTDDLGKVFDRFDELAELFDLEFEHGGDNED